MRRKTNLTTGGGAIETCIFAPLDAENPSTSADETLPDQNFQWAPGDVTAPMLGSLCPPAEYVVNTNTFNPAHITITGVTFEIAGKFPVSKTQAGRIRDDWSLVSGGSDANYDFWRLGDRDFTDWAYVLSGGVQYYLDVVADTDVRLNIHKSINEAQISFLVAPTGTSFTGLEAANALHNPGAWGGFKLVMQFKE